MTFSTFLSIFKSCYDIVNVPITLYNNVTMGFCDILINLYTTWLILKFLLQLFFDWLWNRETQTSNAQQAIDLSHDLRRSWGKSLLNQKKLKG